MKALSAVVVVLVVLAGGIVGAQDGQAASPSLLKATFGKLPIYFIENRGLYPDEVAYYIQGADKTLFFTKDGITFRLKGSNRDWVVKLEFVRANPNAKLEGQDKQQAVFSYFRGPEENWKTGLRTFSKIVYRDLWPGIDLVYYGTVNKLKYEFVVAPGANPAKIQLRYRGVTSVTTTGNGALRVETPEGSFEDAPPEAWQEINDRRVPVEMGYRLDAEVPREAACEEGGKQRSFGFLVGEYDTAQLLILDPASLVYCGYIGGSNDDYAQGIAADGAGNAYVTGRTWSDQQTFPVVVGPYLTYNNTPSYGDVFVAKVNPAGTALVYCGYIGGSSNTYGHGIAVDTAGNAYVTGYAASNEQSFPVKVGPDLTHNGGYDAYVAKLNAAGTGLVYCGYIGGSAIDIGHGIAVDTAGNAYVTGWTDNTAATFPVVVGPDLTYNSPLYDDGFVARISLSDLVAGGTGRIGSTVTLTVRAYEPPGLRYQIGSSLGTGPIPIDTRQIDLSPDGLLAVSVGGWWPAVFSGYRGVIDSKGQAQAAIHIANVQALIGIRLHSAFVTLDPAAPSGIRSISNTETFTITK